jgi:hypothetical protein
MSDIVDVPEQQTVIRLACVSLWILTSVLLLLGVLAILPDIIGESGFSLFGSDFWHYVALLFFGGAAVTAVHAYAIGRRRTWAFWSMMFLFVGCTVLLLALIITQGLPLEYGVVFIPVSLCLALLSIFSLSEHYRMQKRQKVQVAPPPPGP